jgi:hypothetical protein
MTPRDFLVQLVAKRKQQMADRQFFDQLQARQTENLIIVLSGQGRPAQCMAFDWNPQPIKEDDDEDDTFGRIMDSHIRMNIGRFGNG